MSYFNVFFPPNCQAAHQVFRFQYMFSIDFPLSMPMFNWYGNFCALNCRINLDLCVCIWPLSWTIENAIELLFQCGHIPFDKFYCFSETFSKFQFWRFCALCYSFNAQNYLLFISIKYKAFWNVELNRIVNFFWNVLVLTSISDMSNSWVAICFAVRTHKCSFTTMNIWIYVFAVAEIMRGEEKYTAVGTNHFRCCRCCCCCCSQPHHLNKIWHLQNQKTAVSSVHKNHKRKLVVCTKSCQFITLIQLTDSASVQIAFCLVHYYFHFTTTQYIM